MHVKKGDFAQLLPCHCGLGLGPQVATTPGQEAVLPRYCLALAQHWGGVWGGKNCEFEMSRCKL